MPLNGGYFLAVIYQLTAIARFISKLCKNVTLDEKMNQLGLKAYISAYHPAMIRLSRRKFVEKQQFVRPALALDCAHAKIGEYFDSLPGKVGVIIRNANS
jgi:hypothetical protein